MARTKLVRYLLVSVCTFAVGVVVAIYWFQARRKETRADNKAALCINGLGPPAGQRYFPVGAFNGDQKWGDHTAEIFSTSLTALDEPSILAAPACVDEAYRFLWLRSFRTPVVIGVWKVGDQYMLTAKQLNESGQVGLRMNRELTLEEWNSALSLVAKTSFWEMPTVKEPLSGYDGADWVLEGVRSGRYHVVDRWSPPDKNYRAVCVYIAKLSGLPISESDYTGF
jgi:hypothetical protein